MKPYSMIFATLVAVAAMTATAVSQEAPGDTAAQPNVYYCERATGMVVVDGNVNDAAWGAVPWSSSFVDISGPQAGTPEYVTAVKMLWDSEYFYICAVLEEPQLQASLLEHDSFIYQFDNDFEVFIDPDGDTRNYLEIELNALNTVWDLLLTRPYRDGGEALHGWNFAGLKTAVKLGGTLNNDSDIDDGWLVEIAIPWASMQEAAGMATPPVPGDYWRLNFSRVQWQFEYGLGGYRKATDPSTGEPLPEDNWVWSPQGLINMHYPERWGYVVFTEEGEGAWINPPNLPLELARASLYDLYHAQRAYRDETGGYSWDPAMLASYMTGSALDAEGGWEPVEIYIWPRGFSAMQLLPDGGALWIDHTGRTWQAPPAGPAITAPVTE